MTYDKYYKKTKITRNIEEEEGELQKIDKVIYFLILITLLIVPIFIKAHIGDFISPKIYDSGVMATGSKADIFSYYKMMFLVIITVLLVIAYSYKVLLLSQEIKKNSIMLLNGILAILIMLSAFFSPYKSLAIMGMYIRHEGTLTFICYLVIFFIAANMKYSVKQLSGLLYALYPFVIVNSALGFSVFNDINPLDIGWINSFIFSSIPDEAGIQEGSRLWGTVSNQNYLSGIGSVLAILFLTWAIFDKNKIRAGINVIIAILSFSMILTSFSTSGFLTMLVSLPIILILIFFNEHKVGSFIVLLAFVILATSVYIPMVNKNPRVWDETFGFVIRENPFVNDQVSLINVNRIVSEKGLGDIFLSAKTYAEGSNEDSIKFEIPKIPAPETSGGSGRIYIWDKTIETAMKRPILGYGLDTFTFVFPQDDIDKVAGLGTYNITVDKPHNMYLGLLIGSGMIALLVFVLLMGSILVRAVKLIWKRQTQRPENVIILALFTTSIAYLVQGIFNDSVIGSAVIFWGLLGVLVSILNKDKVEGE